jgi:hypothetical protein
MRRPRRGASVTQFQQGKNIAPGAFRYLLRPRDREDRLLNREWGDLFLALAETEDKGNSLVAVLAGIAQA